MWPNVESVQCEQEHFFTIGRQARLQLLEKPKPYTVKGPTSNSNVENFIDYVVSN